MKTWLFLAHLVAFAALSSISIAEDEEIIPTAFGQDRYAEMAKKSPFVLATPPQAPKPVDEPNFTDNLFLKGVGMGFVVVQRAGDDQPIRLWQGEMDKATHIFVKEVKWSDKPGATKVVLEQNGKIGEVGFNENELRNVGPTLPKPPIGKPLGPKPSTKGIQPKTPINATAKSLAK